MKGFHFRLARLKRLREIEENAARERFRVLATKLRRASQGLGRADPHLRSRVGLEGPDERLGGQGGEGLELPCHPTESGCRLVADDPVRVAAQQPNHRVGELGLVAHRQFQDLDDRHADRVLGVVEKRPQVVDELGGVVAVDD